jgi:hypothetical protein
VTPARSFRIVSYAREDPREGLGESGGRACTLRAGDRGQQGATCEVVVESRPAPDSEQNAPPAREGWMAARSLEKAATWLILPVVICLSQRLSHACVSISIIRRNCEWLIKTVMIYLIIESYMDNRDKLQLIHAIRPGPRVVIISTKPIPQGM